MKAVLFSSLLKLAVLTYRILEMCNANSSANLSAQTCTGATTKLCLSQLEIFIMFVFKHYVHARFALTMPTSFIIVNWLQIIVFTRLYPLSVSCLQIIIVSKMIVLCLVDFSSLCLLHSLPLTIADHCPC